MNCPNCDSEKIREFKTTGRAPSPDEGDYWCPSCRKLFDADLVEIPWDNERPGSEGLYWLSRFRPLSEGRTLELVEVYEKNGELLCKPIWRKGRSRPSNPLPSDIPIHSMHGLGQDEARWREANVPSIQSLES